MFKFGQLHACAEFRLSPFAQQSGFYPALCIHVPAALRMGMAAFPDAAPCAQL
jgi:hypothetical protein